MSGPPYPWPPVGYDNRIDSFEVGQSPIGTQPAFSIWDTVISQYANSPILTTLITNLANDIDPTQNIDNFFDLVFNVDTAQGYGLDVWGRIVGVNRVVSVASGNFFGFEEASMAPFGQAPFYSGQLTTTNFAFADQAYRTLILVKAFANICINTIPVLNQMLMTLFPNRGNTYVTEGAQNATYFGFAEAVNSNGFNQAPFYNGESVSIMQMTYTFTFQPTPVELAIVQNSGVLPKPTGVNATVVIVF